MTSTTFLGEVREGRLYFEQPLSSFEGRRVLITVIAPDRLLTPPAPEKNGKQPPDELEVEVDVYAPMPPTTERVESVAVKDVGPARPCLIVPEEPAHD